MELYRPYILHCGDLQYEVSQKAYIVLESVIYWTHCERLDRLEYESAKKAFEQNPDTCQYKEEEIAKLKYDVEQADICIKERMKEMEKAKIPNWVGNGAMEWARNNDLRSHHISEFFTKSAYAAKRKSANEKLDEIKNEETKATAAVPEIDTR